MGRQRVLAVGFNTLLYTIVASVIKFAIGLYLALLLNNNIAFKAFIRAIVLLPFIVPTVLSAIAFWWIFDSQFFDHLLGGLKSSVSSNRISISLGRPITRGPR